jgi:hypothetical protein
MSPPRGIAAFACAALLIAPANAIIAPANALAAHSVGSREQIAWVRRAATKFVSAELAGNGAGVCGVLNAPLRASEHGRTCAERWEKKIAGLMREPGARTRLRSQRRAIGSAAVIVDGDTASIQLPVPLLSGSNRFLWTEDCWMLKG